MASPAEDPASPASSDEASSPAADEAPPRDEDEATAAPREEAGQPAPPAKKLTRARRALELAGRTLDPNARGGPDPLLGLELLRDAIVFTADGDEAAPADRFGAAIEALQARGVLARAAGSDARAAELVTALGAATPPADAAALELFVTKVIDAAEGHEKTGRGQRLRRRAAIALVILTVLSVVSVLLFDRFRFPWRSYKFTVSTTHADFPKSGRLGDTHQFGLVLHTQQQRDPWIEIDLLETREVSRIGIRHRTDCCTERGIPLIVEVAGEDKAWEAVGQQTTKFNQWNLRFEPRKARWVRIRSTANTVLHFSEIVVR